MNAKPHGFTLLEVMVALAIIAIALSAMIVSAGRDAANVGYLRDKTFAHWTAMNVVAEMQARREFPNPGQHLGSETLAGREWFYVMDVEPTRIESMRRVDIVIRGSRSQRDPVLARLSSFYDVPPELPEKDKAEEPENPADEPAPAAAGEDPQDDSADDEEQDGK